MKFPPLIHLALPVALLLASQGLGLAQYTNGQNASYVLGQSNFTNNSANVGGAASQSSLSSPRGVAVYAATGQLFVVDSGNNRILRFSSSASFASGTAAEAVFGQPDFTTTSAGTSASKLNTPYGVTIDTQGNLWVADGGNNRVVCFADAAHAASGPSADLVLGQASFGPNTAGTTSLTMKGPSSVAITSSGTLFVSDHDNNRILRFNNAANKENGDPADGVLGQSNFLSSAVVDPPTSSSLNNPWGLGLDSSGNLWVADSNNNRVLRFSASATSVDGASANLVLGQSTFVTKGYGTSATQFYVPLVVTFDDASRLYVSEFFNNRVMIFKNSSSLTNGSGASFVLGQTNFTSSGSGSTAGTLSVPWGITYSQGYLRVGDLGNNRVLSYAITSGTPTIWNSPTTPKLKSGKTKSFKVYIGNLAAASDSFTVGTVISSASKKKTKSISFSYAGTDITSDLLAGTYTTPSLSANQSITIVAKVTARNASKGGKGAFNLSFTASSQTIPSTSTSKTIKATIKP